MTPRRAMDARTRRHLVATDVMSTTGVTKRVTHRRCGTCRVHVLAALVEGRVVVLDPHTLTPLGELQALTAGAHTWDICTDSTIDYRSSWTITSVPASTANVHATHKCGAPVYDNTGEMPDPHRKKPTDTNTPPPF